MATVLITSSGSGVGQGVLTTLRQSGRHTLIGANSAAFSAGNFLTDLTFQIPPAAETSAYVHALEAILAQRAPDLIIPGHDRELPILAGLSRHFQETYGTKVLVGSEKAVTACTNKLFTQQALTDAGVPFVPSAQEPAAIASLLQRTGFPLVVKPSRGHASYGVQIVHDEQALERALEAVIDPVVQELLVAEGRSGPSSDMRFPTQEEEYSAQLMIGANGDVLGYFASRNALWHGMPIRVEQTDEPALETLARQAAEVLIHSGLTGPFNLQAIRTGPNRFMPFEVNARFTGITPTRAAMGFNECEAAVNHFVDGHDPGSWLDYTPGLCAARYLTDTVFSHHDLDQLQQQGQWRPSS